MEDGKALSQPLLEIALLGGFQVKIDGVSVDDKRWARRSAKSLVKLLALKPTHTLHREQVMDLLWAEESPETAVNNLNKAIHAARRAFEPELKKGSHSGFLLTSQEQVMLSSPGRMRIDLDEFERRANCAIRESDLAAGKAAIGLYKGDLLVEDVFEDWVYTRRESLRILFRKTATKTASMLAANGEKSASVDLWQRLIAEDATDEYVHRLLMRAHAEAGSKYQALKQFELCQTALRSLGVEPESETIQLEQSIKRGEILPVGEKPVAIASAPPLIKQLTFRNGVIRSARFFPDGQAVLLSAAWDGFGPRLFKLAIETGEIRFLDKENSDVYSVSRGGEAAVALNAEPEAYVFRGTLATLNIETGDEAEIATAVQCADWHPSADSQSAESPDRQLAIVREINGNSYLEFPVGNVIFKTSGWLSHPRFSPDGTKIAFIEHPFAYDDRGFVVLLHLESDREPLSRVLTATSISSLGLGWRDDEIWFTSAHSESTRSLRAVNADGRERTVYSGPGSLTLLDVDRGGDVLIADNNSRVHTCVFKASEGIERDLSWHDWTLARDLSSDGETLLFEEAGIGGGSRLCSYVRKTDGSAIKKIGDGSSVALSPDHRFALMRLTEPVSHLALIPIGEGELRILDHDPQNPLEYQVFGNFFPDGKRIIFSAKDHNGREGVFIQNVDGGLASRFSSDREATILSRNPLSPDGKELILTGLDGRLLHGRLSDGRSTPLRNLESGFWLIRWADDGDHVFVWRRDGVPARIYRYSLTKGTLENWLELSPNDRTGVFQFNAVILTPDGRSYAYSYFRESSSLFHMKNLR